MWPDHGAVGVGFFVFLNPTLGLQIAQSWSYLCALDPKVGVIHVCGALDLAILATGLMPATPALSK